MKTRLYTRENLGLFYLSPYVEYISEDNKVIFRNDLFNRVVITPSLQGDPGELVEKLREGMTEEMILAFLKENFTGSDPGDILAAMMQNGILE